MPDTTFKLGIVKLGCLGTTPLLDYIMDERASREGISVRVYGSGTKLDPESAKGPVSEVIAFQPDLILMVSPNAALPGPKYCRQAFSTANIPVLSFGDTPSKKTFYKKNDEGKQVINVLNKQGFIIIPFDPMIGAKKEFLDPTEMALFNSDVIRLLSATGIIRFIQQQIDHAIQAIKDSASDNLPTITLKPEDAIEAAGYSNKYAAAKAYAALLMAQAVAGVTTKACFVEKDAKKSLLMAISGHEMIRAAAILADEAREIEKSNNTVLRTSHNKRGEVDSARQLGG